MKDKKHLKESIEALDYSIAVLQWQRQNLINKQGGAHTMDGPPKPPPPVPCPAGWYEDHGVCVLDVG